ncbi:hypothetical protein [Ralstonia thomasii]
MQIRKKQKPKEPLTVRILAVAGATFVPSDFFPMASAKAYVAIAIAKLSGGGLIRPIGLRHTLDRGRETLYTRCDPTPFEMAAAEAIGRARSVASAAPMPGQRRAQESAVPGELTGLVGRPGAPGSFGALGHAGTGDLDKRLDMQN